MTSDLDLISAAAVLDIPPGDVDAVLRRAARRTERRRQLVAVAAVVALVGTVVGAVQLTSGSPSRVVTADGSNAAVGDAGVTWRRVDVRSGVGEAVVRKGTPLYALSTAAGERDSAKARRRGTIWRSDDGIDWTSVSRLSDDLYLSDLAENDRRIYAVGTAPGTAKVNDLVFGWSDDGAKTWQKSRLPVDMAAIKAVSTYADVVQAKIVSGPKGTVAIAVVRADLDVRKVLPDGVTAPNGWSITDNGVDLLGSRPKSPCPDGLSETPPGADTKFAKGGDGTEPPQLVANVYCFKSDGTPVPLAPQEIQGVLRSYSFAELNVSGDLLAAVEGRPMAFMAGPGSTDLRRFELPGVKGVSTFLLDADDGGFGLSMRTSDFQKQERGTGEVLQLRSADGKTWTTANRMGVGPIWTTAGGSLAGVTTVLGSGNDGGVVLRDDGNGGWRTQLITDLVDPAALDGGTAHLVAGDVGPFGAAAVVVVEPKRTDRKPESREALKFRLLVTRDGVTWQDQALDALAGGQVRGVLRVFVSQADVTVVTSVADGTASRQVALVGTAR
jgi:hypothetical protein